MCPGARRDRAAAFCPSRGPCDSLTDRMRPGLDLLAALLVAPGLEWLLAPRTRRHQPAPGPRGYPYATFCRTASGSSSRSSAPASGRRGAAVGSCRQPATRPPPNWVWRTTRAHALQGNDHPRARLRRPGVGASADRANRRHLVSTTPSITRCFRSRAPCRRSRCSPDISVNSVLDETESRPREEGRARGDAVHRGQPQRHLPAGTALRRGVQRSSLRTRPRDARDHPGAQRATRCSPSIAGYYVPRVVPRSSSSVPLTDRSARAAERSLGRPPRQRLSAVTRPGARRSSRRRKVDTTAARSPGHIWASRGSVRKLDHADTPAVDLLVSILGPVAVVRGCRSRSASGSRSSTRCGPSTRQLEGRRRDHGHRAARAVEPRPCRGRGSVREVQRVREQGVTDAEPGAPSRGPRPTTPSRARPPRAAPAASAAPRRSGGLAEELAYIDRVRTVTAEQVRPRGAALSDPERYGRVAFAPSPR